MHNNNNYNNNNNNKNNNNNDNNNNNNNNNNNYNNDKGRLRGGVVPSEGEGIHFFGHSESEGQEAQDQAQDKQHTHLQDHLA